MLKGVGVRFADFICFFNIKYPNILTEAKLFHFHRIFRNEGGDGRSSEPPLDPPLADRQIRY